MDAIASGNEVGIEIPIDINSLQGKGTGLAAEWRKLARRAFTESITAGFAVTGLSRRKDGGRDHGVCLLTRESGEENDGKR